MNPEKSTLSRLLEKGEDLEKKATEGQWEYAEGRGVMHATIEYPVETVHNHGTKSWGKFIAVAEHERWFEEGSDNANNMRLIVHLKNTHAHYLAIIKAQAEALEFYANEKLWIPEDVIATGFEFASRYNDKKRESEAVALEPGQKLGTKYRPAAKLQAYRNKKAQEALETTDALARSALGEE